MGKTYDAFAEAFREADQLGTWKYVVKPALQEVLGDVLKPGSKMLDLGSASGRVEAGVLLPCGVRAEDIVGVEISPDQVEMARVRIPGATFMVGDISDQSLLAGRNGTFDVVFSSMVFEHLSDKQFEQTCANAHRLLKPQGCYAFVVTHPDKMTDLNGKLVEGYGPFETSAPWGGVVHNWRRSVERTREIVERAGFEVHKLIELPFPGVPPQDLAEGELVSFKADFEHYRKYTAIRLAIKAMKVA